MSKSTFYENAHDVMSSLDALAGIIAPYHSEIHIELDSAQTMGLGLILRLIAQYGKENIDKLYFWEDEPEKS